MGTVGGSYSYNAICDVCGFQYKASELKRRWDGLMVCVDDFEHRHTLDFYRVKDDTHKLPFTRRDPDPNETGFRVFSDLKDTPDGYYTNNEIGVRFTMGDTARKLYGLEVGGVNVYQSSVWRYIKELPFTVTLWDNVGTKLTSWSIRVTRPYIFTDTSTKASITIPLTPTYILLASTAYCISLGVQGVNTLPGATGAIPAAQKFMTYSEAYSNSTVGLYPTSSLGSGLRNPYFNIITGSNP